MQIGYKASIEWIVQNDDCEWLYPEKGEASHPCVTACLVADQFVHPVEKVVKDIRKKHEQIWGKRDNS